MEPDIFHEDDALLAALKEALETAWHPQEDLVMANAQDAFTFSRLDEELASLVYDSLLEPELVQTREATETRTVVFESEALSMEVEIVGDSLFGQVTPDGERHIRVEATNGRPLEVTTDELGCFRVRVPTDGAFRLRITRSGSTTVTEWTYVKPGN